MVSSKRFSNFYLKHSKFAFFYPFAAFDGAAIIEAKRVNLRIQDRTSKIALMTPFIYPMGTRNNLELDN